MYAVGKVQSVPAYLEAVIKESMRKYPTAATVTHRRVTAKEGLTLDLSHLIGKYWITSENCSVVIPCNSLITVSAFVLQNWSDNWGPDASQFIPERWLPNETASGMPRHHASDLVDCDKEAAEKEYISNPLSSAAIFSGGGMDPCEIMFSPFSHGLRNCIGMNLALMEIRQTALQLVKHFTFELVESSMENEVVALENATTLRPRNDLPVFVTLR